MNRLIKAQANPNLAGVRTFSAARSAPIEVSEAELERASLHEDIRRLRAELVEKTSEIERLRLDVDLAHQDGLNLGREAGLNAAAQDFEQHLAVLSGGVGQAVDRFRDSIASLERLAPLLAHQALEKVLGDPANYAAVLTAIINHHLAEIDGAAVVGVEVSRLDFPDPEDLQGLTSTVGRPKLEVMASDQLAPGACSIRLRLGVLEIGIDQQWPRLSELLEGCSRPVKA